MLLFLCPSVLATKQAPLPLPRTLATSIFLPSVCTARQRIQPPSASCAGRQILRFCCSQRLHQRQSYAFTPMCHSSRRHTRIGPRVPLQLPHQCLLALCSVPGSQPPAVCLIAQVYTSQHTTAKMKTSFIVVALLLALACKCSASQLCGCASTTPQPALIGTKIYFAAICAHLPGRRGSTGAAIGCPAIQRRLHHRLLGTPAVAHSHSQAKHHLIHSHKQQQLYSTCVDRLLMVPAVVVSCCCSHLCLQASPLPSPPGVTPQPLQVMRPSPPWHPRGTQLLLVQ